MRYRLAVPIALLLAGVAWWLAAGERGERSGPELSTQADSTTAADRLDHPRTAPARENVERAAESPATAGIATQWYVVEAKDSEGRGIGGATLHAEPLTSLLRPASQCRALGRTDERGLLHLPWPLQIDAPENTELTLRHPEFITAHFAAPARPATERVVLQRGSILELSFRNSSGAGITDVGVVLSRTAWELGEAPEAVYESVAGGHASALHAARSDAAGEITFSGLAGGDYQIEVDAPFAAVTSDELSGNSLYLAANERKRIECLVRPLLAAVAVVRGDLVLNYSHSVTQDHALSSSRIDRSEVEAEARLKERFPDAQICSLRVPQAFDAPETELECVLSLAAHGKQKVRVPLLPAASIEHPTLFEFSALGTPESPVTHVLIELFDSRDRPLDGVGLMFQGSNPEFPLFTALSGKRAEVMAGPGEFKGGASAKQPWIRDRLGKQKVQIRAGEDARVRYAIGEPACKLKAWVTREDGVPAGPAWIAINCANGYACTVHISSKPSAIWLPPGPITGRVTSFGFAPQDFELVLDPEATEQELPILLRG